MKVKLLFPPHFAFEQPYLSLPALTAFLRERGVEVSQDDLSLASFDHFTDPGLLARCADMLERRLAGFERHRRSIADDYDRYWATGRALLAAPQVLAHIESAVAYFRTADAFLDLRLHALNDRIIQEAFGLVSAVYYPTSVLLLGAAEQCSAESSADVFRAIEDDAQNPYLPFFEAYVADHLEGEAPDLVGLSITALTQIIPGLSLARVIRERMPDTRIVIGGVIANHLADKIRGVPRMFTLFDYLVRAEGETPLFRLCQHLEGQCPVTQVPNLLYLDAGEVKDTGCRSLENVNDLPTPDYDGLPLDRYLAPAPVLSLEPARGCYWRKCTFCNQYAVHENTYRVRRPEKTAGDMARLQARHGARLFNIVNEGLPAKHLSQLAEAILDRGVESHWYAGARLERAFTRERVATIASAGCRRLLFGLESGSQRVLDLMRKGIRLEDTAGILTACRDASVDVHLYLMIGFPIESEEERQRTQEFVIRHLADVDRDWFTFCISVFGAAIDTPILEQLPRLGFRLTSKGPKYDLEFLFNHEPADGTVEQASREQLDDFARDMAAAIYEHLPPRRFPEEVTHYLCYRALRSRPPASVVTAQRDGRADGAALLRNGHRFRASPWLTVRRLRTRPDDSTRLTAQHVAYDLRLDRQYVLSSTAVRMLDGLRHPKSVDDLLGRRPRSGAARLLKERLADFVSRGVIEVDPDASRAVELR